MVCKELVDCKQLAPQIIDAIRRSLPARGEKWALEKTLFVLARRLKDVERTNGIAIDEPTLGATAADWYERMDAANPAAMSETDVEWVQSVLKNGFAKARRGYAEPKLQKEALAAEFAKVKGEPLSDAAKRFKNPGTRRTVQLCEAQQRLHPNGDFELGETLVARFVGCSQPRAGKYLDTLREAGVIEMTAERIKRKVARRFRLLAVVKAFVQTLAEKLRDTLGAVAKLVAGMVGKANAASVPSAPAEPEEPTPTADDGDWINGPIVSYYKQPSVVVNGSRVTLEGSTHDETHKRDGPKPKPKRLRIGRKRTWAEVVFELCKPKLPKQPAQFSEPEPI